MTEIIKDNNGSIIATIRCTEVETSCLSKCTVCNNVFANELITLPYDGKKFFMYACKCGNEDDSKLKYIGMINDEIERAWMDHRKITPEMINRCLAEIEAEKAKKYIKTIEVIDAKLNKFYEDFLKNTSESGINNSVTSWQTFIDNARAAGHWLVASRTSKKHNAGVHSQYF